MGLTLVRVEKSLPLLPAGAMLLLLLEIGIFFGGADDVCDIDDIVLAVSAAMDGDRNDDTGDVIDCDTIVGDFKGCIGCIGSCTGCTGGYCCCTCIWCAGCCCCACCCALSLTGLYLRLFLNNCGHVLLRGPRCPLPSFLSLSDGCCCEYGCMVHLICCNVEMVPLTITGRTACRA
jgi:hypothetical protein